MVIFNNELSNQTPINTKINYYLKITSATISDNIVKMNFVFLDGKDTFPLTGNYSQKIDMFYNYPVNGTASHAEGSGTLAIGANSHAEGTNTIAKGISSHAEGAETVANGIFTHAEGCGTQAEGSYSHVQGKYNEIDMENKYAHIVGNGTSDDNRSNAHAVDWEGNAWYAGSISSEAIVTKIPDLSSATLISEQHIDAGITSTIAGFKLVPYTYYLVIINNVNYICFCSTTYRNSNFKYGFLGDKDKYGFEIHGGGSIDTTNMYFKDSIAHDLFIYQLEANSVNLISYIDELKSRIKALEDQFNALSIAEEVDF